VGTGADTIAHLVIEATRRYERGALKFFSEGRWQELSYPEFGSQVREVARGLLSLDLNKGDVVAIFSATRPEWVIADLAASCAGLPVACVYHTSSPEEALHVLENSRARLIFCEDAGVRDKVEQVRSELPDLEHVVLLEGEADDRALTLRDLRERGSRESDEKLTQRVNEIQPDDLFTLVYTSGTTGPPKGCMLSHRNLLTAIDGIERLVEFGDDSVCYAFLPLAHVLTRMIELLSVDLGAMLAFGDPKTFLDDLAEVRPTHFIAVPRIFEKIYSRISEQASGQLAGRLFDKAIDVGRQVRELERRGERPGPLLKTEYELADRQLFSKVRDLFGGRLRLALTGAAPVKTELLEFFEACGVAVREGYGLSETAGVATLNTLDRYKFGTQGAALPGVEIRTASSEDSDDSDGRGEVLVRGANIFAGYYRMPEETAEDLDEDGWFHTGDLGFVDDQGFLTISGRTKDIIITSSGKNITPVNLEAALSSHRWLSQAVVYGDDKNYLVALLTLDPDEISDLAEQAGTEPNLAGMAENDDVHAQLETVVDETNQQFAQIEQVKKFAVLDRELSQEQGELTPTMKVKRQRVYENHRQRFEALYDDQS
jgi:long-chain acyl-CoA synthetase